MGGDSVEFEAGLDHDSETDDDPDSDSDTDPDSDFGKKYQLRGVERWT